MINDFGIQSLQVGVTSYEKREEFILQLGWIEAASLRQL